MSHTSKTWRLRERIVGHVSRIAEDRSTNPRFYNRWFVDWPPERVVHIVLQRRCRHPGAGQVAYMQVECSGRRMLLKELREFADWLTDKASVNKAQR